MSNMNSQPTFYVVATPIGNLDDITHRAINILSEVDTILCEDTRTSSTLFQKYNITTPYESYHAHSTQHKEDHIIKRIQNGETFALISDAGTPTISDPGVKLIDTIQEALPLVHICPIPGPTALIAALSVSGFAGNDFRFFGFIPHKKGREQFFEAVAHHQSIALCYESPHRVMKTLEYLSSHDAFIDRRMVIARELTKKFESIKRGGVSELYDYYMDHPQEVKGEFVIIFDRKV